MALDEWKHCLGFHIIMHSVLSTEIQYSHILKMYFFTHQVSWHSESNVLIEESNYYSRNEILEKKILCNLVFKAEVRYLGTYFGLQIVKKLYCIWRGKKTDNGGWDFFSDIDWQRCQSFLKAFFYFSYYLRGAKEHEKRR